MTLPLQLEHDVPNGVADVMVRPIEPGDVPRLQAFHARLSPETIYGRYLSVHPMLSLAEAEHVARVDCQSRMALVATRIERGEDHIIGIARYECLGPRLPHEAEAAVVVEDRYQGRGIGKLLLSRLADYARAHGIRTWVAEISGANDRILNFVRRTGLPMQCRLEANVWELRVQLV